MSDERIKIDCWLYPTEDADIIEVLKSAPKSNKSRVIRRLIRSGLMFEAAQKIMPNGGFVGKIENPSALVPSQKQVAELEYEPDPDIPQPPNSHFHPAPKPGARK